MSLATLWLIMCAKLKLQVRSSSDRRFAILKVGPKQDRHILFSYPVLIACILKYCQKQVRKRMQIFTYELTESELMNWQDNVIVQFRKKNGRGYRLCAQGQLTTWSLKEPL